MRYVIVGACLLLAACGTMNGLGQDMQNAGAKLSQKATDQQRPPPPPPPAGYTPYGEQYEQP
jgi:predicted small secreted protein